MRARVAAVALLDRPAIRRNGVFRFAETRKRITEIVATNRIEFVLIQRSVKFRERFGFVTRFRQLFSEFSCRCGGPEPAPRRRSDRASS